MRTNNKLLNNFLQNIMSDGLSENTAIGYESDLMQFINYISKEYYNSTITIDDANNTFFQTTTFEQMNDYKNKLYKEGKSANTRSRAVTSIKQFWEYLFNMKVITNNPAEKLTKVKIPKREAESLTVEESRELLNTIGGEYKERNYAIVSLFLNSGLRLSELVGIDITDIKDNFVKVLRKGNEIKFVPLNEKCLNAINEYLKVRPDVNCDALFISERKKRISNRAVRHMVKKYTGLSGIDKSVHPHTLRHSCLTMLYQNGVDLKKLQELANHKNINTTADIYVHLTNKDMMDAVNANPLNM